MKRSLLVLHRFAALSLLALVMAFSCRASSRTETMGPLLAGRWYPADAKELASAIDGMMAASPAEAIDDAAVLIVPHAGYQYSGKVAGCGYATLRGTNPGVVVILAPSHQARLEGCAVLPVDRYDTPLGGIQLDRKTAEKLAASRLFTASREAFAREHAFEIQLPFLQRLFGAKLGADIAVLPVLVGEIGEADARLAASKIVEAIAGKRRPLFVVSSDFTHYGERFGYLPFREHRPAGVRERLRALDGGAIEAIVRGDSEGFSRYVEKTGATICGRNPIRLALSIPFAKRSAKLLAYDTSCNITGECDSSVSYASIGIFGTLRDAAKGGTGFSLSTREKRYLLDLARANIRSHLFQGKALTVSESDVPDGCRQHCGVFVTLKKSGELRGCIGIITGIAPLYQSVIECSYSSAFRDPRFEPLARSEINDVSIEISVLTEPHAVRSPEEIVVGRDGIIIEMGGHRGLLLPQVAIEYGWTREEFLVHACRKAGLPDNAWRSGATIYTFQALVFGEDSPA